MKKLLCVLFLFFSILAFSQQAKLDSLSIEFHKAKQDTIKAEILAKIGIAAYYVDFKKARFYNDSLIHFSKSRSKKYEALGYRMQGTLELIDGDYINSEKSYIESLGIFEEIEDKGYQGALIANLATLYARQNQITKADSMYLAAIDVLKDVKDEKQTVNCYINLGINALNANKLELATNYFVSTLKRAEETDNKYYQFYAHNQLGMVYLKRQLYDNAKKNLNSALGLGKELEDKTGLASVYNSFGALSDELKDHSKALEYFLLSKESADSVNDKDQLPKAYINMGRQYEILNDITNAKISFEKAIEITKSVQQGFFLSFHPKTTKRKYISGETHLYMGRQYRLKIELHNTESVKLKGKYIIIKTRDKSKTKQLVDEWYLQHAKIKFYSIARPLIEQFKKYNVEPSSIILRDMATRWGSCTPKGKIILNPELIKAPKGCIEYVIIHELCHLIHHDHTRRFIDLQTKEMPDWERWKSKLEKLLA